ncbi:hypothetical protein R1sor_017201 [Riccia sorocarpa]|uniref:Uncharacterized protein n=1 Tax=Riccia sorocarpa TaxID=122646 RepID=A0ABD3I9I3_9MARC
MYTVIGASDPGWLVTGLPLYKDGRYTAQPSSAMYTVIGASEPRRLANEGPLFMYGRSTTQYSNTLVDANDTGRHAKGGSFSYGASGRRRNPDSHDDFVVTISTKSDTAPFEQDEDSSDVEIIETTPRRRPPTRSRPLFQQFQHQIDVPSQFGIPIVEVDVDVRQWHICRTSNRGSSLACFAATPGRSAPRALCKTKIRVSSLDRQGVGVVAPTFIGRSSFMAVERDYRFWFCPNGNCHRGPVASTCRLKTPPVPDVFPVQKGTGLTSD